MSLKNVDWNFFDKISLRARLTVFYSLTAFLLLTIISLFLYWETINILYKTDHEFLSDEVETIQHLFEENPVDQLELKKAVLDAPQNANTSVYRYYTRVIDSNMKPIIETPGMARILPLKTTFIHHFIGSNKQHYWWYANRDTHFLLVQAPVQLQLGKYGIIQIALDISYQHSIFNDRKIFIVALLSSAVCALFLGFFISHRGMHRLYLLTNTAKKISASSLHKRIDPQSLPKELCSLAIAFNQMLDRIEASFIRLKLFSSDLAHELRTPINNMIGQTEITLAQERSLDDYKQVLGSNLEELQRMSHLIENILFLSRAENPQLDIQKQLLNIHQEIESICEYYQAIAEEKKISVSLRGQASLKANPIMFRRMINNILSNALNYTLENGKIEITISEEHDNTIAIKFRDTGIGISEQNLSKIFDRFYRVDDSRSQQPGFGLGLPIVKSIVELHHGSIAINSEINKGTTVILTFKNE